MVEDEESPTAPPAFQVRWLTKEMDDEAVAVAVDVGGRVGLELDGDVGGGGVELEPSFGAAVLTQDFSRQVISVVKGHQVVGPDVQAKTGRVELSVCSSVSCFFFFFPFHEYKSAGCKLRRASFALGPPRLYL